LRRVSSLLLSFRPFRTRTDIPRLIDSSVQECHRSLYNSFDWRRKRQVRPIVPGPQLVLKDVPQARGSYPGPEIIITIIFRQSISSFKAGGNNYDQASVRTEMDQFQYFALLRVGPLNLSGFVD